MKTGSIGAVLAASALALAGCGANVPQDAPLVQVTMKPGAGAPQARRFVDTPVVARKGGDDVAAACTLTSPFYRASFTAPARLALPDYGPATPEISVACRTDTESGATTAKPSSEEQQAASVAGGAFFGVIGAVAAYQMAAGNDGPHFYPSVVVRLK